MGTIKDLAKVWLYFQQQHKCLLTKSFQSNEAVAKASLGLIMKSKRKYKADRQRKNLKIPHWKRRESYLLYKTLQKEVKHKINHAKIAYHQLQVQHLSKEDSKPFWSEVKRLFDYKKCQLSFKLRKQNHKSV